MDNNNKEINTNLLYKEYNILNNIYNLRIEISNTHFYFILKKNNTEFLDYNYKNTIEFQVIIDNLKFNKDYDYNSNLNLILDQLDNIFQNNKIKIAVKTIDNDNIELIIDNSNIFETIQYSIFLNKKIMTVEDKLNILYNEIKLINKKEEVIKNNEYMKNINSKLNKYDIYISKKEDDMKNLIAEQDEKINEQKKLIEKMKKDFNEFKKNLEKKYFNYIDNFKKKNKIYQEFLIKCDKFKLNEIKQLYENKKDDYLINPRIHQLILNNILPFNEENNYIITRFKFIKHINILLVGPSGAGKTTLKNAILKIENEEQFTNLKQNEKKLIFSSSNDVPFLKLCDLNGYEHSNNYLNDYNNAYNQIQTFILNQLNKKNIDEYIHCIWFCWSGNKLEDDDILFLNKLNKKYLDTIPIILVYTNAIAPNQEEIIKKYPQFKNDFIEVLAKQYILSFFNEKIIIEPYNIDKLLDITFISAKKSIQSMYYKELKEKSDKNIINTLTNDLQNKISTLSKESNINNLYKEYKKCIYREFKKYNYQVNFDEIETKIKEYNELFKKETKTNC